MPLIDLSAPIRSDPPDYPESLRTEIRFEDHAVGAAAIEGLFGVGAALLRDGEGWATETLVRFGTCRARCPSATSSSSVRAATSSQIERLVNLAALPPEGFEVTRFPLRIEEAGAAPARVVAIVPEGDR